MIRVNKEDIKAGMITAERITDLKNNVLLEANTEITQAHEDILKTWDIEFIRIREATDSDESLQEQLLKDKQEEKASATAPTRQLSSQELKTELGTTEGNIKSILAGNGDKKLYSGGYDSRAASGAIKISSLLNNRVLDGYAGMIQEVDKMFSGDAREREFFVRDANEFAVKVNTFIRKTAGVIGYCLYPYRINVGPLAVHTMRTAIIAGKLAQIMNYKDKDCLVMIMGALLHDIGLSELPDHMKSFKKKFTEQEMVYYRKHVLTGINMVKNHKFLPKEVLLIIGSHHEMLDGSGYPLKLKEDKIPAFVRVVALANEVTWLLYPMNSGTEAINIAQLIEKLPHMAGKFDAKMCAALRVYFEEFLLSNRVTLDDGRVAEVIWSHKTYKDPVVRTSEGEILDLNKITGLTIDNYSI